MTKIINEKNYSSYIHYLESNLIGLSMCNIFKNRILSSIKNLLYVDKVGNLSIVEDGKVYVKKANDEKDYLLTKLDNSDDYSLFIKDQNESVKMNLNNWCIVKHKIFKNFYLTYPYMDNDKKTLKFIAKEGKINLIATIIVLALAIIGFLS